MELLVLTIAFFKVSFSILRSVVNNPSPVFHPGGFIETNFVDTDSVHPRQQASAY